MDDRTPLVLLHPYPLDAAFWDPMRRHLDPRIAVLAPNAPGFGDRAREPGWRIDDAADNVAELIRRRTRRADAVVMGISMGGYIALAIAVRHPDVCAGLVLADTRPDADDDRARAGRSDAIAAICGGERERYLAALLPRLVAESASGPVRARVAALAARASSPALTDALEALAARPDRSGALAGIAVPALVIVGAEDQVTPPGIAAEMAAAIPGALLLETPGAGHLSALEQPALVARAVQRFVMPDPDAPAGRIPGGV